MKIWYAKDGHLTVVESDDGRLRVFVCGCSILDDEWKDRGPMCEIVVEGGPIEHATIKMEPAFLYALGLA